MTSSAYPAGYDKFSPTTPTETLDKAGAVGHSELTNTLGDALIKMQGVLGLNPQGAASSVGQRIAVVEGKAHTHPSGTSDAIHAAQHAAGGKDPVTPAAIGALAVVSTGAQRVDSPLTFVKKATFAEVESVTAVTAARYQIKVGTTVRALAPADIGAAPAHTHSTDALSVNGQKFTYKEDPSAATTEAPVYLWATSANGSSWLVKRSVLDVQTAATATVATYAARLGSSSGYTTRDQLITKQNTVSGRAVVKVADSYGRFTIPFDHDLGSTGYAAFLTVEDASAPYGRWSAGLYARNSKYLGGYLYNSATGTAAPTGTQLVIHYWVVLD